MLHGQEHFVIKKIYILGNKSKYIFLFHPVSGERRVRWSRGWAVARSCWALPEAGQQRHPCLWDRRWPRQGDPRRHSGGNHPGQRQGNLKCSAHSKVDHSGSGFLRHWRRAGWVGREHSVYWLGRSSFCRKNSAIDPVIL